MTDEENPVMRMLLGPPGSVPAIGAEWVVRTSQEGDGTTIVATVSKEGSTRYVAHSDDMAVAVLQLVSMDGRHAVIANAFTVRERRRQGHARRLLEIARRDFERVDHSDMVSESGRAFAEATC